MLNQGPVALPKAALVTGGAIVEALAEAGFAVAIHYHRSENEARLLADTLRAGGRRAVAVKADLSAEAEVAALHGQAETALGPLGLLVNNASVFDHDGALSATRESWDKHLEPNLRAPFVLSQAFAKARPAEAHGLIVNLIDQRVWNLTPNFVSYTVSKAGLWTLTQTLALAYAPHIRVNAIGPGPTLPSARQSDERFAAQCERTPLKRGPTPEEIARTVLFMLETPSMTGQMIALDGGQHLGWSYNADERIEE
jgi:NAD(P)-dependent dehydrogenase (short-subunit alcohol dehydrogenase family)